MRSLIFLTLLVLLPKIQAEEYLVNDPAELQETADSLQAGDTLVFGAGYWEDVRLVLRNEGTPEAPITLKAETPGSTVLRGATRIAIGGSHIVLEGLHFQNAYTPITSEEGAEEIKYADALVDFMADPETPARDSRITNCYFEDCNPAEKRRYHWIRLWGQRNRVDHCRFEGQDHSGVTVQVRLHIPDAKHRIDHNYFFDRKPGDGNGFETIQLGQSWASMSSGKCVVEDNIFESCDGETEIISSKTCDNMIRANLFLRSYGTLTIRHGNRTTAQGNVFIADGKANAGGIRVIGEDHRVIGNYFRGIDSYRGAVIVLYCGIPDGPLNGYAASHRALIANNILVHSKGNIFYLNGGFGTRNRIIMAEDATIENNIIVNRTDYSDTTVSGSLPDIQFSGNLHSGGELGLVPDESGFTRAQLSLVDEASDLTAVRNEDTGEQFPLELPTVPLHSEVGVNWIQ